MKNYRIIILKDSSKNEQKQNITQNKNCDALTTSNERHCYTPEQPSLTKRTVGSFLRNYVAYIK